jgi:hypothetical protein
VLALSAASAVERMTGSDVLKLAVTYFPGLLGLYLLGRGLCPELAPVDVASRACLAVWACAATVLVAVAIEHVRRRVGGYERAWDVLGTVLPNVVLPGVAVAALGFRWRLWRAVLMGSTVAAAGLLFTAVGSAAEVLPLLALAVSGIVWAALSAPAYEEPLPGGFEVIPVEPGSPEGDAGGGREE